MYIMICFLSEDVGKSSPKIRSIIILPIKTVHVGVPRWAYFISGGEDYRLPGSTTFFAFKCWLLSSPLTIMAARDRWGYIYI